jgi:hypothetical protein
MYKGLIALFTSAGTITYSWVADATEITTLCASIIGLVTATIGAWFYFEKALTTRWQRCERTDCTHYAPKEIDHGKKGSRNVDRVSKR